MAETTTWFMGDNGLPDNTEFIGAPASAMEKPYPYALWRIDPTVNDGLPFHELLPGISGIDLWAMERENVIRVYDIREPQNGFDHKGLAILEPVTCKSVHNDKQWDVTLVHPLDDDAKWKHLIVGNVLKIGGQLFRIDTHKPSVTAGGMTITVHANHISCDMADMLITFATFPGGSAGNFIDFCFTNAADVDLPGYEYYKFEGYSDIQTIQGGDELVNVSIWAAMVGADNCLLNRCGGELYRDNFYFSINQRMQYARDNAFCLRYTLDMTGISQEVDYSDFCTNLYCYDNYGNMWGVSIVKPVGFLHHPIARMVQFNYSEPEGALDRLMSDGFAYWLTVSTPKVTYEVPVAALGSDPMYDGFRSLQNYNYGDSGTIYCPELDISTSQRITEIERDEITGDITRMILGNLKESLVRPTYMGSTISTGRSQEDKQMRAMQTTMMAQSIGGMEQFPVSALELRTINQLEGR